MTDERIFERHREKTRMRFHMSTLLLAAASIVALTTTPAMAFYTECTVTKDTELATRPNGPTEPRYKAVNKGDKLAFRGKYQNWWFVMHASYCDGGNNEGCTVDYGWLPENILTACHKMEGTP